MQLRDPGRAASAPGGPWARRARRRSPERATTSSSAARGGDFLFGKGSDWLEGGDRFDTLAGENSELFFNSTIMGHDVLLGWGGDTDYEGEPGDEIMSQNSEGIQRSNGMAGFDPSPSRYSRGV